MEDVKEQCDEIQAEAPSSSNSKDLNKTLPEEAFNNFLQGKRHMLVKDFQFAVQSLGTACELYVKHFGELATECAEVYFLYGKALFRLSQQQAGILGGALNDAGSNDDDTSSENESKENESEKTSEEDGEEGGEGGDENDTEAEKEPSEEEKEPSEEEKEPSESTDSPQAVVDEGSSEAKAKDESPSETSVEASTDASKEFIENKDGKVPATDAQVVTSSDEKKVEKQGDENQEAEEDDLELAWNTLETAKTIFNRQDTAESQLKVAEILLLLAEISMESDNNKAAISDLEECLKIQTKHLKPDDRILAETYYQMGLAQLLAKQFCEAIDNFKMTKQILELRLENLKNTPIDDKSDGSFASADKDLEITDLENILLDIQEKVEDTEELMRDANEKEKKAQEMKTDSGAFVASPVKEKFESSTTVKPISNITHLLKRKKPDEATSEGDTTKRIKLISVSNGESKAKSPDKISNADGKV